MLANVERLEKYRKAPSFVGALDELLAKLNSDSLIRRNSAAHATIGADQDRLANALALLSKASSTLELMEKTQQGRRSLGRAKGSGVKGRDRTLCGAGPGVRRPRQTHGTIDSGVRQSGRRRRAARAWSRTASRSRGGDAQGSREPRCGCRSPRRTGGGGRQRRRALAGAYQRAHQQQSVVGDRYLQQAQCGAGSGLGTGKAAQGAIGGGPDAALALTRSAWRFRGEAIQMKLRRFSRAERRWWS